MILLIYLKQIRKDYFTDKYVFINSNNFDFSFNRSNPSITSNICVICNKSKHNIIFQPDSLEKILSPQSNSTISEFDIDNKSHQEILIADEPTTALDVTIQAQIIDVIKKLQNKIGMSIIWITHDLGVVAGLVDRVLVMYAGSIVDDAPVKDIFKKRKIIMQIQKI